MMPKQRPFNITDTIVIDYETTGLMDDQNARPFALSLTWTADGYTEIYRDTDPAFTQRAVDFWKSPCAGIAHNLQFELEMTRRMGWAISPDKRLYDTMVMHQYIDNLSPRHGLDYVAERYAGPVKEWREADAEVGKAFKIYGRYDRIPEKLMSVYQRFDGERTALIFEALWPLIRGEAIEAEYDTEIELIKTTVRMVARGFMVHTKNCNNLINFMTAELETAAADAVKIVGGPINLNSPKQLTRLLFTDLNYPKNYPGGEEISTDKTGIAYLDKLKPHPIFDCILKARTYKTGVATICGYLEAAAFDGAVHPGIKTNHAKTGRESSQNPNLQNVSNEVRAGVKYTVPARSCFRARPGYYLILADYAGIEMRLGVQGTESTRLYKLCADGFDFHAAMAETFYGARYTNELDPAIKKALRNAAKSARFAMFYGAGLPRTADTLKISIDEAAIGYEQDRADFPEFYEFMAKCSAHAQRHGWVKTFFGRQLRVPAGESYAATDYVIQGSAAALFKHAQVAVDRYLKTEIGDDRGRLILPVHDELVIELRRDTLPFIKEILSNVNRLMIDWPQISVAIAVEYQRALLTWDKKETIEL